MLLFGLMWINCVTVPDDEKSGQKALRHGEIREKAGGRRGEEEQRDPRAGAGTFKEVQ